MAPAGALVRYNPGALVRYNPGALVRYTGGTLSAGAPSSAIIPGAAGMAKNPLLALLGQAAGPASLAYETPGSSPGGGMTQNEFKQYAAENRFRTPALIAPTDTGRGLANLPSNYKAQEAAATAQANQFQKSYGAGWQQLLGLPANYQPGAAAAPSRGQAPAAGAGPNGPNPNALIQGQDGIGEEYRQRMNAYNNQAILARQALQGYDPSKGPLPGAAQEAQDQGMEIWRGLYGGTKMGQPGGAVGTFNPLMQARGDVPSMEELWKGIGGGAPTTGPSNDAIKAAMAKGAAPGGFYPASAGPVPTATSGFDTSFDPAAEAQAQQFRTASQAGVGTEASTALQRAGDFVQNYKLGALNPNNYSLPSADYLKNFDWNADYSSVFK